MKIMRFIFVICCTGCWLTASSALAAGRQLYDNGTFVTDRDGGLGGADASLTEDPAGSVGWSFDHGRNHRLADDFTVPAEGWHIGEITAYGYQTFSGIRGTMTALYAQIWDGPPSNPASTVVWGNLTNNILSSSGWTHAYRLHTNQPNPNMRPVMYLTATVDVTLVAGTYWLDFQAKGLTTNGPFSPPVTTNHTAAGNALMFRNGMWEAVATSAGAGVDLPFTLAAAGESEWTILPSLPVAVSAAAGVWLDGKFYVFGGEEAPTTFQIFDAVNGTWSVDTTTMTQATAHAAAVALGGDIYVLGGEDYSISNSPLRIYHPGAGTWETMTDDPLPLNPAGIAAAALDGKLYAFGGDFGTNTFEYDPAAVAGSRWTEKAGAPCPLMDASAVTIGDVIGVAANAADNGRRVLIYDPVSNLWAELPELTWRHAGGRAWAINSDLVVGGGEDSSWVESDENEGPRLPEAVSLFAAASTPGGFLYVAGGFSGGEAQSNVLRYGGSAIASVTPSSGSRTGGYEVVISGQNLGDDEDITNVTLCGAAASAILSQSGTQVVVRAGFALPSQYGLGAVRVFSTLFGQTMAANAFTYTGPGLQVSGAGDFGHRLAGTATMRSFAITNSGAETLTISGFGISDSRFQIADFPAQVSAGGSSNFTVTFTPDGPGNFAAALAITNDSATAVYTVNFTGSGTALSTNLGPCGGGNTITVTNGFFGTITNVLVGSTSVSPASSGSNWFTIVLPPATNAGAADIVVQTSDQGEITLSSAYTYNPAGAIASVAPASGPATGGTTVTITGTNLGNGADITGVTLCGFAAGEIISQSATQVVVTAGAAGNAILGDVRVFSTSFGETIKSNAYAYTGAGMLILGMNGVAIGSGDAPDANRGGMMFALKPGLPVTNVFAVTNTGAALLTVSGVTTNGNGSARFATDAGAMSLPVGGASNIQVVFTPVASGISTAALLFANNSPTPSYALNLQGRCAAVSPDNGPFAGGNTVTITNTHFGVVTNILLGGSAGVPPSASGEDWVSFVAPTSATAGAKDIVVQSATGQFTLPGVYTVNAAGVITGYGDTNYSGVLCRYEFTNTLADSLGRGLTMTTLNSPTTNGYTTQGWYWVASGVTGSGLDFYGPTNTTSRSNYTLRIQCSYSQVSGWRRLVLYNYGYEQGPYITNGRAFGRGPSDASGPSGPVNTANSMMDIFVQRSSSSKRIALWQVTNGTPVVCSTGEDNAGYFIAPEGAGRPSFKLFICNNNGIEGYAPSGVVRRVWLWDKVLSESEIKAIYQVREAVEPAIGHRSGGYTVTIRGSNLCDGTVGDVTGVTLCGVPASVESVSGATQIVVTAGCAATVGLGNVAVVSTSRGTTTKVNGFTYTGPDFRLLGTNGAVVASGSGVSPLNGTLFAPLRLGLVFTNRFAITNRGTETLTISGFEISNSKFEIAGLPASVAAGTASNLFVKYAPDSYGDHAATVIFTNNATNFVLNLAGSCFGVSTNVGPLAGGNILTVTNGHFGNITNVLVGSAGVSPASSGSNWFTITLPAATNSGAVNFIVQTSDRGDITLANAYTYNPAGVIPDPYRTVVWPSWIVLSNAWLNGTNGVILVGAKASDECGIAVSSAGDVNGDGIADFLVGADEADPGGLSAAGETYLVYGRASNLPATVTMTNTWLNGTNGVILAGAGSAIMSGSPVSQAGDVNGDGVDDVLVSAWQADPGGRANAGETYLVYGNTNGLPAFVSLTNTWLNGTNGVTLVGAKTEDRSGYSLGSAGDVNGDGFADLLIGAYQADPLGKESAGEAYLVYGRTNLPASIILTNSWLDGTNGVIFAGIKGTNYTGYAVSGAGDVNGDGLSDFLIGAWTADPPGRTNAGETYLVFGRTNAYPALVTLTNTWLDGTNGVILAGARNNIQSGISVGSAGDVNGDGFGDVMVGANIASGNRGETYLVFGRSSAWPATITLTNTWLDGDNGVTFVGANASDYSSRSIRSAGDADGDGLDDLLIGAYYASPSGLVQAGEAYLVFGRTNGWPATITLTNTWLNGDNGVLMAGAKGTNWCGDSVSLAGDVNGDGISDFLVGADKADPSGRADAGEAYLVYGKNGLQRPVIPASGLWTGGYQVVITGTNMGNGGDITNVTLCGIRVSNIVSQSSTQIVVVAGVSSSGSVTGDVRVFSTSYGETVRPNAFTYLSPVLTLLGTNGAVIQSGSAVSPAKGTDFGPVPWGTAVTNTLTITNTGNATLHLTGIATNSADPSAFQILPASATIPAGGAASLRVVFQPASIGDRSVTYQIASDAAGGPMNLLLAGQGSRYPQFITFDSPGAQLTTNRVGLAATASSALSVSFAVASGPAEITGGTNLSFSGAGSVSVVASQPGNTEWLAAPSVTNTFAVSRAVVSILLTNLEHTYDGASKSAAYQTDPPDLAVILTYNGSAVAPSNAGAYAVTGTVDTAIYTGVSTALLTIAKANQTLHFPAISNQETTNAVALTAIASSGLAPSFATNGGPAEIAGGSNLTFIGAGTVSIVASQAGDANWNPAPSATNSFEVTKAIVAVTITNLTQIYDGTEKPVGAVTEPAGLAVALTYEGNTWAPTNAGVYWVTGTVNEAMYQGASVERLTIAKASQVISDFAPTNGAVFPVLQHPGLSASASSGLAVTFSVISGAALIEDGTNLVFSGLGAVAVTASQAGNANYHAAPTLTNVYTASGGNLFMIGADGVLFGSGAFPSPSRGNDFGTVATNETVSVLLAITNAGDANLTISGWTTNGSAWFALTGMPAAVEAGGVSNFWLVYAPRELGLHEASLLVASDGLPAVFELRAVGTGIKPGEIGLNSVFLGFAATYGDSETAAATYTITNKGGAGFAYTNTVASGNGADWFALHAATGWLEPGAIQIHTGVVSLAGLDAGNYVATNTVSSPTAVNSPVDLLVNLAINKATQGIAFAAIDAQWTTNRLGLAATASSGLPVVFSVVDGPAVIASLTNLSFTGAGIVRIAASQTGNVNYAAAPSVTNAFAVNKVAATVTLTNLSQSYDGTARIAGYQTDPADLAVILTYNGGYTPPILPGAYAVTGAVDDAFYAGSQTGTLSVGIATADVFLGNLSQVYDGTPKYVTATTMPAGVAVEITYNGEIQAPTAGGHYVVTARVTQAYYTGAATGTLDIARADQTITFAPLGNRRVSASVGLAATASSGLPVVFSANPPGVISDETNLTFTGAGEVYVVASQPGNAGYNPAPSITNGVRVYEIVPDNGPCVGGHMVVVSNGALGTVTNILLGAAVVTPLAQGGTWVTFAAPVVSVGTKDVVIQSDGQADIVFSNAYTVNPAGVITGYHRAGPYVWTNMGWGVDGWVNALAMNASNVFAGGVFESAGFGAATNIAVWDGTGWNAMEAGAGDEVLVLLRRDSSVYLGGAFESAGGIAANRIAMRNGTTWSTLGAGLDDKVYAIAHDGFNLYVGGSFWTAGNVTANYVAVWNGLAWTNLGEGMNALVTSLTHDGTNLYAAGWFSKAGGAPANQVAKWNGINWTNLGDGVGGFVNTMIADGARLYVGGSFTNAGGLAANNIAMWDGASWTNLGSGFGGNVYALAGDSTRLFVGGDFTNAGGAPAHCVAVWNGVAWTNVGYGMDREVLALAYDGENLYAGGAFSTADGLPVNAVAQAHVAAVFEPAVSPASGVYTGGFQVAINGQNLGNGSDITNVTLCGVSVSYIASQSATQVVVIAGPGVPGLGDVRVFSTSFGETMTSNVFMYLRESQAPLVFTPASPQAYLTTNALSVSGGSGTGAVSYAVLNGPGMIVDGTNLAVTAGSGSIAIRATKAQDDLYFEAAATGTVTAMKGAAGVYLQGLTQTYDGTARNVTATTMPAGLTVVITYDGNAGAPTNAGNYAVTGTVSDADWRGAAAGTLAVGKASQTIAAFMPTNGSWFAQDAMVGLSATASSSLPVNFATNGGPGVITSGTNLSFTSFGVVSILATQPGDANWLPSPPVTNTFRVLGYFTLEIVSAYGMTAPPVGVYTNLEESVLTNQVHAPDTRGTTQYQCRGWIATENLDPNGGEGTQAVVTVKGAAVLTWLWETNYWFNPTAGPHGAVDRVAGWFTNGEWVSVGALADAYYHLTNWTGDASGQANPLNLLMDAAKAIMANFAENTTTNHGTPEWWLAKHGFTTNFESAAAGDQDGDRVPTWEEEIADTDPTNPASYFHGEQPVIVYGTDCWQRVVTNYKQGGLVVTQTLCNELGYGLNWLTSSGRLYGVAGELLLPHDQVWLLLTNYVAPGTNLSFILPRDQRIRIFRLNVSKP